MINIYAPKELLDPDAPNFRQHEVGHSDYAIRNGIDNKPSVEILSNAIGVAVHCMQPIRNEFGLVQVNSWYRGEQLEKVMAADGFKKWCKKNSFSPLDVGSWKKYFALKQHPKGNAVDFEVPGESNDEVFEWCKANLDFDQLIREYAKPGVPDSGWVHISWVGENNRRQILHIP